MGWKENLRPARFRDAEFKVPGHEAEFGRHQVTHEFPLRDRPYVEDMGRRARVYQIEAYVVGPDYMARRDALVAACEEAGPGQLVHPYLGTITVSCRECHVREDVAEGGLARFRLAFVESGENRYPAATPDHQGRLDSAVGKARDSMAEAFARNFSISSMPDFVRDGAVSDFGSGLGMLGQIGRSLPAGLGLSAIAELTGAARELAGQVAGLVATPLELAQRVVSTVSRLGDLVREAPRTVFDALTGAAAPLDGLRPRALAVVGAALELARFGEAPGSLRSSVFGGILPALPETTTARRRQIDNRAAIVQLLRGLGVAEAIAAAPRVGLASYDELAAARDRIADRLETLMLAAGDAGDDQSYLALSSLRAAAVTGLTALGANRARLVRESVAGAALPALVLAYARYEDIGRETEILARNPRVQHPGLLPAGQEMELLSA